jgi:uncharacterized protein (DUF58 family)
LTEDKSTIEILKKAKLLELVSKRNSVSLLDGHFRTTIPGRGTEFREARKYVAGESIRLIDWNMTARLGEPHVKIFQEERERNIILAIDVSPSMYFGWQEHTKLEYAIEMAATIAYSAIDVGDRLGFLFFQDKVLEEQPARRGKKQLYQALHRFVHYRDNITEGGRTDIRSAIHAISKYKSSRSVVFLISDFIDLDIPDDMRYLVSSHDVAMLHVYDPLEYFQSDHLKFYFKDPEDSKHLGVGEPGRFRTLEEQKDYLKKTSIRYGLSWDSFPSDRAVHLSLGNFFQKKRRIGR